MPPTANSSSGKTSVCSRPRVDAWRSASVPGSAAAWPANAETPPSRCRSAKSMVPKMAKTRIRPHMKTAGPSMAIEPMAPIEAPGDHGAVGGLQDRQVDGDQDRGDQRRHQGGAGEDALR